MITGDQVRDVPAYLLDDTRTFMTQHHRTIPGEHVPERHVRVADAGGHHSHDHLVVLRLVDLDRLQHEWPALGVHYCRDRTHARILVARSGGLDFDEARVVGRRPARGGAIVRQHVGTAALIHAGLVGREPRAFLDRYHARRDPVGDADGHDGRAAAVENADTLTVGESALRRIRRMHPHV